MNTYKVSVDGRTDEFVDAYSFSVVEGNLIFYAGGMEIAAFGAWRSVVRMLSAKFADTIEDAIGEDG